MADSSANANASVVRRVETRVRSVQLREYQDVIRRYNEGIRCRTKGSGDTLHSYERGVMDERTGGRQDAVVRFASLGWHYRALLDEALALLESADYTRKKAERCEAAGLAVVSREGA